MNLKAVLEGILFIVGDEGTTINDLKNILNISEEEIKNLLLELKKDYESEGRGLRISYLGNSFKLTTKKEHIEYYKKLGSTISYESLSQASLETRAISAYNEPITRVQIDEIRGISSSFLLKKLVAKDLIKVCGKSDLPGRPNLYKTTQNFLDYFGLASLKDLPDLKVNDNDGEIDLYKSKFTEEKNITSL